MLTWKQFTSVPNGTEVFNHGWNQCVALANFYHEDVVGGSFVPVPSAYMWWDLFQWYPTLTENYVQSQTPVAGAIFVARYGVYNSLDGHIGVVTSVNSDGTFSTMEQNAGTWRYVGRYRRTKDNVLGFLIPKDNPAKPSTPAKPVEKPKPTEMENEMQVVYYAHAFGKGKQGWLVMGVSPKPLILASQSSANEWQKSSGRKTIIARSRDAFAKYLEAANGSKAQLKRIG